MKVCPECGTQYEDHVPTCIADGATLASAAPPAPIRSATPAQLAPVAPPPATPPPAVHAAPPRRGALAPLLLLTFVASLLAVTLLIVLVLIGTNSYDRPARFEPVSVLPAVRDPVPAAPEPARELPPVSVALSSDPEHAKVYENEQFVCETPCTIQHPAHAPLPRSFVFRADGYRDGVFDMVDASQPVQVRLSRARTTPAATPAVPRPTIGRER